MKTSLLVNNRVVPLNDFTQNYIANVLCAIARSLGYNPRNVTICIEYDELRIYTENGEIDIKKDFAKTLIQNTLKGMLSPLKGILWFQKITITANAGKEL
ncbi:MAG: hypothetical protein ACOYU2_01445 [Nitrospirota bacterium]|jgi:hypothetical protein